MPKPGTPVIQLDINPEELGRHYPNRVSLWGDAKLGLQSLMEAATAGSAERRRAVGRSGSNAGTRVAHETIAQEAESAAVPIRPERICRELSRHLPANTLVVSETGHAGMWTGSILDLNWPGRATSGPRARWAGDYRRHSVPSWRFQTGP